MEIKNVYKALAPLRNRMHLSNAILCFAAAFTAAGTAGLLLSLGSLIIPVPFLPVKLGLVYAAAFTLALAVSPFLRPGRRQTVRAADALGLKERFITAAELCGDDSPISRIQRYDAYKAASSADFRKLYKLKPPLRLFGASLALAALIGLSLAIPSPARTASAEAEKLAGEIKKQAENIDKERKKLAEKSALSEKQLEEVNKKIDSLLKELKASKNESDALKALSRTGHELDKLKKGSEDLQKLAGRLSANPSTKALGDAIRDGRLEELKQDTEELNNTLKNMDESERKALADRLNKMAEELENNPELAAALSDLSRALASGGIAPLRDALSALGDTVSRLAQADGALADAVSRLQNAALDRLSASLDNARSGISGSNGGRAGSGGQPGSRVAGGQDGQGTSGQGASGQGASGQGQGGQGQGAGGQGASGQSQGGQGAGKGGSGAGTGSSNRDAGGSGAESGGGGRQQGRKTVIDYESIYVPDRLGGDGQESQISGKKGAGGESSWSQAIGTSVETGSMVPYGSVIGRYKSEALSAVDNQAIPPVMKDIVRDYFTSLE